MKVLGKAWLLFVGVPVGLVAQESATTDGIQWAGMVFRPEAGAIEAYDNRVEHDRVTGDASSDFYTELAGGLSIQNLPARYDLSATGRYGYRFYSEKTNLNDDFYNARVALASGQNPLTWGLSADVDKSLNYNTAYDPATGNGPDSILSDQPNRRMIARGNVAYEKALTEKTTLTPGYGFEYYNQEFQGSGNAEWQIHTADVEFGSAYSERTRIFIGGYYSLQAGDKEDGSIGTVTLGAEGKITDKTSWLASVGVAAANYELSGSDQSGVFNVRLAWALTEKVSTYVFGGNDYQPGYGGGGARMVYRVGYGANWQPLTRWTLGGTVLHDYQDSLGGSGIDSPGVGEVRNFFTAYCGFKVTQRVQATFSGQYIDDEFKAKQTVVALGIGYRY